VENNLAVCELKECVCEIAKNVTRCNIYKTEIQCASLQQSIVRIVLDLCDWLVM